MNIRAEEHIEYIEVKIHRPTKIGHKKLRENLVFTNSTAITFLKNTYGHKIYFPTPLKKLKGKLSKKFEEMTAYAVGYIDHDDNKAVIIGIPNKGYTIVGIRALHKLTKGKIQELPKWQKNLKTKQGTWCIT